MNCIIIVQFPIENHSEQGQFAELSLKTIGKSEKKGDYYAIRSSVEHHSSGWFCAGGLDQMRSSSTATSIKTVRIHYVLGEKIARSRWR